MSSSIIEIPLEAIYVPAGPGPSVKEVDAMATAFRLSEGMLHPIGVRPVDDSPQPYELVYGRARMAVAQAERQEVIECRILQITAEQAVAVSLLENAARTNPPQLRQGWAIRCALEATGWSQAELARVTTPLGGWSEGQISELSRAAAAVPEAVLDSAASQAGVNPQRLVHKLTRETLRVLLRTEDEDERRDSIVRAAEAVRDGTNVLWAVRGSAHQPSPAHTLGDGAVRIDLAAARQLSLPDLVRVLVSVGALLIRLRIQAHRGLRRSHQRGRLPAQQKR